MNIEAYGVGGRLSEAARLLSAEPDLRDLILLPIPITKDGENVTGTDIPLSSLAERVKSGSVFVGYSIPEKLGEEIIKKDAKVLDLSKDEEFLLENARLTAIGALGYILNNLRRAPQDTVFGVIGYGRIGSALVRMLLFLGAKVKIYTGKILTRIELGKFGLKTEDIYPIKESLDLSGVDVLINTAPIPLGEKIGGKIRRGLTLIELASGENFEGIEGVVRLPALPEKMYPESGGLAYFSAVMRYLSGEGGK